MDPERDGKFLGGLAGRRSPDIEIEAILAELRVTVEEELRSITSRRMRSLDRRVAESVSQKHAFPRLYGLRLLPTEVTYWRSSERDTFINGNSGGPGQDTLDLTAVDSENRILFRAGSKQTNGRSDNKDSFHDIVILYKFNPFRILAARYNRH
jgi:hypothetical protein